MKITVLTAAALVCLAGCQGATTVSTCQSSSACQEGQCCRDSNGKVLGNSWGFFDLLGSGTCVAGKAQAGERCGFHCQCDTGLECYRPMTGVCCVPETCMDAAYVQQQREYWANCRPPTCFFPA